MTDYDIAKLYVTKSSVNKILMKTTAKLGVNIEREGGTEVI